MTHLSTVEQLGQVPGHGRPLPHLNVDRSTDVAVDADREHVLRRFPLKLILDVMAQCVQPFGETVGRNVHRLVNLFVQFLSLEFPIRRINFGIPLDAIGTNFGGVLV